MKKVLLVLSKTDASDQAISFAVDRAKEEGIGLVALYILESGLANEVFDTFTDIGFIGERPSAKVSESIMKEYRQRGYEELGRVQGKAKDAGVECELALEQGDFVKKVIETIKHKCIGYAVLVRKARMPFFRFFSRSPADEVKEKAGCEVVIFNED